MVKLEYQLLQHALDGHKSENKTVLNMVSRIQNRNTVIQIVYFLIIQEQIVIL